MFCANLAYSLTRNQKKAAKRREKNRIKVKCLIGHEQAGWTLGMVNAQFGLELTAGAMVSLDLEGKCETCNEIAAAAPKAEIREARGPREPRKPRDPKEFAQKDADRARDGVLHRFRAEQQTRVTLHNVHFVHAPKNGPQAVCKASFQGKVTKVEASSENAEVTAKILVSLLPRQDLSFQNVHECQVKLDEEPAKDAVPTFLEMKKTPKGTCYVQLNYSHVKSRDVGLVYLGCRRPQKSGEEKKEEEEEISQMHVLDPITQLQILPPSQAKAVTK